MHKSQTQCQAMQLTFARGLHFQHFLPLQLNIFPSIWSLWGLIIILIHYLKLPVFRLFAYLCIRLFFSRETPAVEMQLISVLNYHNNLFVSQITGACLVLHYTQRSASFKVCSNIQINQVTQGLVQLSFEHLQGWGFHNWLAFSVLTNPYHELLVHLWWLRALRCSQGSSRDG